MIFLTIIVTFAVVIYAYFKISYSYWKNKNVPFIQPTIPFGNRGISFKSKPRPIEMQDFYNHFKGKGFKYGGIYSLTKAVYFPIDTNIIKHILQVDFDHFHDRGVYFNEKDQPLGAHLFAIGGEKWRNLRQKLTPTFTTGKMKSMFETLLECVANLDEEVRKLEATNSEVFVKEVSAKFTTDVIGSCAFGITCNSFKNPDAEFRSYGKKFLSPPSVKRIIRSLFVNTFPNLGRALRITTIPKDLDDFFTNTIKDVIAYRDKHNIIRNDFVELLRNINKTVDEESKKITFDEMVAQAFVFFIAGFETSSTTTNYCMFELALNQDIQDRTRDEILRVLAKYDNKITYDGLMEMKYLKQVIDETLRKYPPVPTLDRICTKSYKVPGTDLVLDKGTSVIISTLGLQRDEEHFPDPEKFDPERFSEENFSNIKPFTYMPFGEGPRVCIGLRFGVMQTKVGLITLLKDYRYTLSKKTNPNITFDQGFILTAKEDILLNIEKVN